MFLFYFSVGRWMVGENPESNVGGLKSVQTGLPTIPVTGWQYSDGGWKDDDRLTVAGNIFIMFIFIHSFYR
jgi:hypothetical protein